MQKIILINLITFVSLFNFGSYSTPNKSANVDKPHNSNNYLIDPNDSNHHLTDQNDSDRHLIDSDRHQQNGKWVRVLITAYSPWDAIDSGSGYQDGMTSTMVNTMSGNPNDMYGIAADPSVIPYGTRIYVPAYWDALQNNKVSRPTIMTKVDDTGGIVRSNWRNYRIIHLDLRFRTSSGAIRWIRNNSHRGTVDNNGRLWMDVFIYD